MTHECFLAAVGRVVNIHEEVACVSFFIYICSVGGEQAVLRRCGKACKQEHECSKYPFHLLFFFACYKFLVRDEPLDCLYMTEEPEGNDSYYCIAWNRYYQRQRSSDVSHNKQDDEYLQRL